MHSAATILTCGIAAATTLIAGVIMQKITGAGTSAQEVRTVVSTDSVEAVREMLYLDYQLDDTAVSDIIAVVRGSREKARIAFLLRGYGFTLDAIGKTLGISHQAVSKALRGMGKKISPRLQN